MPLYRIRTIFPKLLSWKNLIDTFKISFNTLPVAVDINGGFIWDRLVGWYYYKRGSQIIYSNYSNVGNSTLNTAIQGGNENLPSNKVEAFFKDPLKDQTNKVTLLLNTTQNQITWRATEIGLIYTQNRPAPSPGMTQPSHMTFIKL